MEVSKESPSGMQQPVGTAHRIEELARYFFSLPLKDQMSLLLTVSPLIVPRFQNDDPDEFVAGLRGAPREAKLSEWEGERAESRQEIYEDLMNQSIGGQEHFLKLVAPRVVTSLDARERTDFLAALDFAIRHADTGEPAPTIH